MLCSASKDSDALLRLEGLVAYCVGFASMIIAYCVGFASMIMPWRQYGSRAAGAGVLRPRRRRQYRPASYSQAESKCVITN